MERQRRRVWLLHHCPSARAASRAQALLTSKVSAKSSQPAPPGPTSLSVVVRLLSAATAAFPPPQPGRSPHPVWAPRRQPDLHCLSSDVCCVPEPPAASQAESSTRCSPSKKFSIRGPVRHSHRGPPQEAEPPTPHRCSRLSSGTCCVPAAPVALSGRWLCPLRPKQEAQRLQARLTTLPVFTGVQRRPTGNRSEQWRTSTSMHPRQVPAPALKFWAG
ncbi:hypothetical protein NDU88_003423 [Pleurodeles waltl]|uniref:Uncharacterized protein n=1 Tax=Pleurodeles waltl TaxID=8319 RepID=A0AAV7SDE5_PLEWA|nr:hypothetical protein NDU88_003423 [Pleurodeles waltl]